MIREITASLAIALVTSASVFAQAGSGSPGGAKGRHRTGS